VVPPDDGVARVGAKVAGRVTRFTVGVGDPVTRGQAIATLDSPELGRAKADYIAALAAMTVTRQTADREQALFERKISVGARLARRRGRRRCGPAPTRRPPRCGCTRWA
jgi:cobalt-zinc-cadmium efflux system membrane fusion protein